MNRIERLDDLLRAPVPIDGGLATALETRGADLSGALWSAKLLVEDPAAIRDAHVGFIAAGARVVITASYQASREGFASVGLDGQAADHALRQSIALAREAVDATATGERVLVAASVGPYGAIRHDGSEYVGRYGVSKRELIDFHRRRLDVLAAEQPDLLAVETIPDADEAEALVEVLADHPDLPAWISFSCRDAATVCAGQPFADAVAIASAAANVRAVGVNCTAPEFVTGLLTSASGSPLPFVVYPNAGRVWDGANSEWLGEGDDRLSSLAVNEWIDAGARLVGGCCGLGAEAVADLAATIAARGSH